MTFAFQESSLALPSHWQKMNVGQIVEVIPLSGTDTEVLHVLNEFNNTMNSKATICTVGIALCQIVNQKCSKIILLLILSVPDRTYQCVGFVISISMEGEAEPSLQFILQTRHISIYGLELTR